MDGTINILELWLPEAQRADSDFAVSSTETERLDVWETLLSWLGLRGRETDSKLDSPED